MKGHLMLGEASCPKPRLMSLPELHSVARYLQQPWLQLSSQQWFMSFQYVTRALLVQETDSTAGPLQPKLWGRPLKTRWR